MTKLTPAQEVALNRLRASHDRYMDAKRTLRQKVEDAFEQELRTLNLERSQFLNQALRIGVPKSRTATALRNQNWDQLQELSALTAKQFANGGAQILWYGDAGDEWRVSKDGRVAALVVLEGVRHLVQYDTYAEAWEYAEQRDDFALYPTDEDPESIPQSVRDAVLTKLKECPKLPNATLGEWDALVAADPGAGSLGDALKS